MLKIWGRANSINVQKVLWCCGELNLPFERIDAGMQFGVNNTPEYKAKNPNGLVPLIDDDGFVLWESQPIVRYLARKHSLGSLCPADAQACADADRWMDWNATTVWPNLRPVFWNLVRTEPAKRDLPLIATSRKGLAAGMILLDAHLAARSYVAAATSRWATFPSAYQFSAGSGWTSSAKTCRTSPHITSACRHGPRTRNMPICR